MQQITVKQECLNRGECRYGLRGVKVKVPGYQGEFRIRSSDWGAGGLELTLNSKPEERVSWKDGIVEMTLGQILDLPETASLIIGGPLDMSVEDLKLALEAEELPAPDGDVTCPADRCFLRSYWQPVCCGPRLWNEFNSKSKAKAAGVPILPMP